MVQYSELYECTIIVSESLFVFDPYITSTLELEYIFGNILKNSVHRNHIVIKVEYSSMIYIF